MVRVIPREEVKEKESTMVKAMFWFAFLLLVISGGLAFLVSWQTDKSQAALTTINNQLSSMETKNQKEFKESIFNYKRKIDDMVVVLKDHKTPTKLFQILESTVHPNVVITDMAYRGLGQEKIGLSGQVTDLTSLAQQMVLFQRNENIDKVSLSSVVGGKGVQIAFRIELTLKPTALIMQ